MIKKEEKNIKLRNTLDKIGSLLHNIMKNVHTHGRKILIEEGLDFPKYYTLSLLKEDRQHKMSELRKELVITGAGATVIADRLIKTKLAIRRYSSIDRRVVYIAITDKGRKKLNAIRRRRRKFLSSIMNKISGKQQKAIIRALEVLFYSIRNAEE